MEISRRSNPLLDWYRQYFGSLQSTRRRRIYTGFATLITGVALTVLGWVAFAVTESIAGLPAGPLARQLAVLLAGAGLPTALVGAVSLFMADTQVRGPTVTRTARVGYLGCLAALGVFLWAYPARWNVAGFPDYSLVGVTLYGLGLGTNLLATGSAVSCRR